MQAISYYPAPIASFQKRIERFEKKKNLQKQVSVLQL